MTQEQTPTETPAPKDETPRPKKTAAGGKLKSAWNTGKTAWKTGGAVARGAMSGAVAGAKAAYPSSQNVQKKKENKDIRLATMDDLRQVIRSELRRNNRRKAARRTALGALAALLFLGHCSRSPDKLEAAAKADSAKVHETDKAAGGVRSAAADFRHRQINKWIERTADADRAVRNSAKGLLKERFLSATAQPAETNAAPRPRRGNAHD